VANPNDTVKQCFDLRPKHYERFKKFTQLAYTTGFITENTPEAYIKFCLSCGGAYVTEKLVDLGTLTRKEADAFYERVAKEE
jgi:hypothetical protein